MEQNRVPRGVRAAGQFAAATRTEPSLTLAPADTRLSTGPAPLGNRDLLGTGTLSDRNPAWTAAALKRFLGDADKLISNPVYRTAPPMRMYLTSRVEAIEATDEWKEWEAGYQRRSAANRRRKAAGDMPAPKVELGRGRNGFYPVVQR